jgi:vibriolysin
MTAGSLRHLGTTGALVLALCGCASGGAPSSGREASDGTFLVGELGSAPRDVASDDPAARERAAEVLDAITTQFGVHGEDLVLLEADEDELGKLHLVYQQVHRGLTVEGATLAVHVESDRTIYAANGSIRDASSVPIEPLVDEERAIATVSAEHPSSDLSAPELVLWVDAEGAVHLAWAIEARDEEEGTHDRLYVDARVDGIVGVRSFTAHALEREMTDHRARPVRTYTELSPPTDAAHAAAFERIARSYACLGEVFERDGMDGVGGPIRVHLTDRWNRSFFDLEGGYLEFGVDAGGGHERSDDTIVHEMGHGVLDYAADLQYDLGSDSAALHEGLADVFAAICQWHREDGAIRAATWQVFEDAPLPDRPTSSLRYLHDPARDGRGLDFYAPPLGRRPHPAGGIVRLAFYLAAQGGAHPRRRSETVDGLGIDRAARIFYRAIDVYFTARTSYHDARAATVLAARELEGDAAAESIERAWGAVGVVAPASDVVR